MPKFEKQYVYCMWSDELEGKKVFYEDGLEDLRNDLLNNECRQKVTKSDNFDCPFHINESDWRFVYYDPYYDLKLALEQGQTLQIQTDKNTWEDIEGECDFTIESQYLRVKPLPARITCRELSMWLSSGQGECKADWDTTCQAWYLYREHDADLPVPNGITVRKWHDDVWHIPTKEYIDQEE